MTDPTQAGAVPDSLVDDTLRRLIDEADHSERVTANMGPEECYWTGEFHVSTTAQRVTELLRDFAAAVRADALFVECPECAKLQLPRRVEGAPGQPPLYDTGPCPHPLCVDGRVSIVEMARAERDRAIEDLRKATNRHVRASRDAVRAAADLEKWLRAKAEEARDA